MVRDSIESQADAFRATRFLFDSIMARGEILDEIVNLSLVSAEEWEKALEKKLWDCVSGHVFDQILMPAWVVNNAGLRVIQLSAMEDRAVPDRRSWDSACQFMSKAASSRLAVVNQQLKDARGPGFINRWVFWHTPSADNHFASAVQDELTPMLASETEPKQSLSDEDVLVIKRNLETKGVIEVPTETIRRQWNLIYKKYFLEKIIQNSRDCLSLYQHYRQGFNEGDIDCQAVVLFHRYSFSD
ncbi:hypothetical protein TELCIR_20614 [Teladorsagia circumcincta]|uniref:Dynamin-like GTPase OPA1 C-terminal domain-containing protein n=1 Tax=Teladorsagia circumcincta TaxID=45464 RepID=A0A2G9TJ14_TELCI|nr:hypothetical protein TELCIR_20614 [Teladorsagia circumcincta]